MKTKWTFFAYLTCLLLILNSCNRDNEIQKLDSATIKNEFKEKAISIINKNSSKTGKTIAISTDDSQSLALTSLQLIKSYGLSDSEIAYDLNGISDDKLIEAAMGIIAIEDAANKGIELFDPADNTSLVTGLEKPLDQYGKKKSEVVHCALEAVGINAIGQLINDGIRNMGKSAVKKLLKKVASRYLGYIGAAIAVHEFGDCMDWW